MASCDTNVIFAASNPDDAKHAKASSIGALMNSIRVTPGISPTSDSEF